MSDDEYTEEFLAMFLAESQDRFESLNQRLLELEQDPTDAEAQYAVLRDFHSIKGSSAMFGFLAAGEVAHRLEDLLNEYRTRPDEMNSQMVDILLRGSDLLRDLLQHAEVGDAQMPPVGEALLLAIDRVMGSTAGEARDGAKLATGLREHQAALNEILPFLSGIANTADIEKTLMKLTRLIAAEDHEKEHSTEDDGSWFFTDVDVSREVTQLSAWLTQADESPLPDETEMAFMATLNQLLDSAATCPEPPVLALVADARETIDAFSGMGGGLDEMQIEYYAGLLDDLKPFMTMREASAGEVKPEVAERRGTAPDGTGTRPGAMVARKSVRVEEAKIDAFLDSVGEMIILGEVYSNLAKRFEREQAGSGSVLREFRTLNANFGNHIFTLQHALMDIRRVEVRNITGSLQRLARDTAQALDKDVRLEVEGEKSVLDKSLLDDVNTCLVHIVRNAISHGIESPENREAAGKSRQGRVTIHAANEDGKLFIRITDDGRGIDADELRQRAVELGTLTRAEAEAMTQADSFRLIFAAGLSTAEDISGVSGRGVGMNAVLEMLENMGGTVTINSQPGTGTDITLRVPLSVMLSVVDGLVVAVGENEYVIPIRHIVESFLLREENITQVQNVGECVRLRDKLYPLIRLRHLFAPGESAPGTATGQGVAILIQMRDHMACLHVDAVQDHQQVVIKNIDGIGRLPGMLGGALLGAGHVGLVLDVEAIMHAER